MSSISAVVMTLAFVLDQIVGDPKSLPHPVVGIGRVISILESLLNYGSAEAKRIKGVLLAFLIVGGSWFLTWIVVKYAYFLNNYFGIVVEVYLIFTTLAGKSLLDAGRNVLIPLKEGDLEQARVRLSWLVSRNTSSLPEGEVVRGTVETIAENFVDGILSPLIYAFIGGAPLAMAFKAISTLDSMVGYKNERFNHFGWFSAKADDWANFVPARISVLILLLAGWFYRMPVAPAYNVWKRDAKKHPSPNGGNPESIVAGLLKIKLGGMNIYDGRFHYRAEMGEGLEKLSSIHIEKSIKLIRLATLISFSLGLNIFFFVTNYNSF